MGEGVEMRKQKEEMARLVSDLLRTLIDDRCTDMTLLTLADQLARRSLHDTHRAWVSWEYYIESNIFAGSRARFEKWAKANAESLP